ncbi:MAG TPA: hypothetical protein VFT53_02695 [Candidatus Saccharimonadales bacterium]|nr:hypothetical protein [Candidatus Saccharimonadales bacterium]
MSETLSNSFNCTACEQCFGKNPFSDCPRVGGIADQASSSHPDQVWTADSWNEYLGNEQTMAHDPDGPCERANEVDFLVEQYRNQPPKQQP